jgi:hypothetical protein
MLCSCGVSTNGMRIGTPENSYEENFMSVRARYEVVSSNTSRRDKMWSVVVHFCAWHLYHRTLLSDSPSHLVDVPIN